MDNITDEFEARKAAIATALQVGATHYFMVSSLAKLEDSATLQTLIGQVHNAIVQQS